MPPPLGPMWASCILRSGRAWCCHTWASSYCSPSTPSPALSSFSSSRSAKRAMCACTHLRTVHSCIALQQRNYYQGRLNMTRFNLKSMAFNHSHDRDQFDDDVDVPTRRFRDLYSAPALIAACAAASGRNGVAAVGSVPQSVLRQLDADHRADGSRRQGVFVDVQQLDLLLHYSHHYHRCAPQRAVDEARE